MKNPRSTSVERLVERNLCTDCERRRERDAQGICQFRHCYRPEYDTCGLCYSHLIQCVAAVQTMPEPIVREYAPDPIGRNPMTTSVVYYVSVNGQVKIGTTINLRQRMQTFCLPTSALLAIEPGGREVEQRRHKQFSHLRVERELFEPSPQLAAHINAAREMFGDPAVFMAAA
jgi:hypothetical protein